MIALAPAGRERTSGQRSWSRCSVSQSPSGNTTFRCALSCTSGRSSTASTRLARRPGAMCPDSARSDAWAVPPGPSEVTSAAATVRSSSLISTDTVRSHGSQRSSGRGAKTAAGRAVGPVPVTVSGLLGLLTELTPRAIVLAACRGLEQTCPLSLTITSRHRVPARDKGPHTGPGKPFESGDQVPPAALSGTCAEWQGPNRQARLHPTGRTSSGDHHRMPGHHRTPAAITPVATSASHSSAAGATVPDCAATNSAITLSWLMSGAGEDDELLGRPGHRDIAVDGSFDACAECPGVDEDD